MHVRKSALPYMQRLKLHVRKSARPYMQESQVRLQEGWSAVPRLQYSQKNVPVKATEIS